MSAVGPSKRNFVSARPFSNFSKYVYFFQSPGVKARSQRSVHPFVDENYLRIMTVAFLLVLLMFSEKGGTLAPQGKCICRPFLHQNFQEYGRASRNVKILG